MTVTLTGYTLRELVEHGQVPIIITRIVSTGEDTITISKGVVGIQVLHALPYQAESIAEIFAMAIERQFVLEENERDTIIDAIAEKVEQLMNTKVTLG